MKFGSGQSWESQSTPEMKLQAAEAFAKSPPAIVQPAQMTPSQFKAEVKVCLHMWGQYTDRLLELYESFTKRWEEFGKTRDLAAEEVFGLGWHTVKDKIRRLNNKIAVVSSAQSEPITEQQNNEECLSQVEKVRQTPAKDEQEEKPAVHAATPEQMGKAPPKNADEWEKKEHFIQPPKQPSGKPSENGKPKHSLAIWKELEEVHFGRALNRIDELNRQCPNPKLHTELIAADKRCITILEQWRQEVAK